MAEYEKIYKVDRKPASIPSGCTYAWQMNVTPPKIWYDNDGTITEWTGGGGVAPGTYQLLSGKSAASGYASLDGSALVPVAELPAITKQKGLMVRLVDAATDITVSTDYKIGPIPSLFTGMDLIEITYHHDVAGAGDSTNAMLYNRTDTANMLSANLTIAAGGIDSSTGSINTAADDVVTNDRLELQIGASTFTTTPKGLIVNLIFE